MLPLSLLSLPSPSLPIIPSHLRLTSSPPLLLLLLSCLHSSSFTPPTSSILLLPFLRLFLPHPLVTCSLSLAFLPFLTHPSSTSYPYLEPSPSHQHVLPSLNIARNVASVTKEPAYMSSHPIPLPILFPLPLPFLYEQLSLMSSDAEPHCSGQKIRLTSSSHYG